MAFSFPDKQKAEQSETELQQAFSKTSAQVPALTLFLSSVFKHEA